MWFIIRHGETLHNTKGIIQGHYDSLLTIKGMDQLKSIGYRLSRTEEDFKDYKLISSPMNRARQSMQIIQEILNITNISCIEDDLLTEVNAGLMSNMSEEQAKIKFPILWDSQDYLKRQYPDGENNNDVYNRVVKFYEKYKNEKNMIILTHNIIIKCLFNILLDKNRVDMEPIASSQDYFFSWNGEKFERL